MQSIFDEQSDAFVSGERELRKERPMPVKETVDSSLNLSAVAEVVAAHTPFTEGDIISALQDVQDHYGYLPRPAMDELARLSGLPVAKFYGVATFYAQFYLEPHGKHTVRVCRGTACHVRGAPNVMLAVTRRLKIEDGETTPDMLFSLETVACLGTCFLSPVMLIGNQYFGRLTPDRAVKILETIAGNDGRSETEIKNQKSPVIDWSACGGKI